jgi:hypothetical protein
LLSSAMAGPGVSLAVFLYMFRGILRAVPSPATPHTRKVAGPAYHPPKERNDSAWSFGSGHPRGGLSRRLRG